MTIKLLHGLHPVELDRQIVLAGWAAVPLTRRLHVCANTLPAGEEVVKLTLECRLEGWTLDLVLFVAPGRKQDDLRPHFAALEAAAAHLLQTANVWEYPCPEV